MLETWLEARPIDGERGFTAEQFAANEVVPELQRLLAHEVLRNYVDMRVLRERARRIGLDKLAAHIDSLVIPTATSTRIGDFGEIFAGLTLRKLLHYTLPILKLRYKIAPNALLQLIDIVAFKFSDGVTPTIVAVVEVKTSTTRPDADLGAEAVNQLREGLEERLPLSLHFIDCRLMDAGKEWLAGKVEEVLAAQAEARLIEERVVLVVDADQWHDAVLQRIQDDGLASDKLTATVYLIGGLRALIDKTYQAAKDAHGI